MGVEARRLAFAGERNLRGQQLVQQTAERVDVDARVDRLAGDLLRRDVVEGADEAAGLGQARLGGDVAGDAEVGDVGVLGTLLAAEQDVGRLDVAVDLGDQRHRVLGREPTRLREPAPQVRAGDVAHRDPRHPLLFAGGVDGDHVGMLDRGGDPRLLGEPAREDVVGSRLGSDQLQRHPAVQARLQGEVEDPHPAPAQAALDPVAGELVAVAELGPAAGLSHRSTLAADSKS